MNHKIEWEKIRSKFNESIKIKKDAERNRVIISFLDSDLLENDMFKLILENESGLKDTLRNYTRISEPINYDIEIDKNSNVIIITFKRKKVMDQSYDFFEELFHGDLLKEMIEAIFGAFGGFYGNDSFFNFE
ncbi:MAG: hypothetical protein P8Y70_02235 [Candidatus Lokiarchaeota archaeon]